MPEMDGFEASQQLKNSSDTADIPIIIVSASACSEDEEKLNEVVEGYLTKPVSQVALLQEMKKYLKHPLTCPVAPIEQFELAELVLPDKETLAVLSELAMDGDLDGVREILMVKLDGNHCIKKKIRLVAFILLKARRYL